jgi:hypothetical protein
MSRKKSPGSRGIEDLTLQEGTDVRGGFGTAIDRLIDVTQTKAGDQSDLGSTPAPPPKRPT